MNKNEMVKHLQQYILNEYAEDIVNDNVDDNVLKEIKVKLENVEKVIDGLFKKDK